MVELRLEGLNCAGCAAKIQTKVGKLEGVSEARVNLALEKIEIEMKDEAGSAAVIEKTEKIVKDLEPHVKVYPFEAKKKSIFYLNGLHCAGCAAKIEAALVKHEKLNDVTFSFATKKLQAASDLGKEDLRRLVQAIVDRIEAGVSVDDLPSDQINQLHVLPDDLSETLVIQEEQPTKVAQFLQNHWKTMLGALLLVLTIASPFPAIVELLGYGAAYVLIGGDIVLRALKNLRHGQLFDENFLMTLATVGAFALGEYTEAVAVMLFYKVGEGFQDYAVDQSRKSIQSLLNIKAEYANLMINGNSRRVIPDALSIGDQIMIRAGEKVPVDGKIVEGQSNLDTSALTGESMPRMVNAGDEVLSGAINLDATLIVEVVKTFENSTVARILDMVENATGKKAKTEQFITKFARVYTPIVVISAGLLSVLPPLLGFGDFREWVSRALIFLVISCPCALVLSVPLGFFGGLGAASRKGILLKGGNYLEALNQIDTFVFDKTGTLTKGNFAVQQVAGADTLRLAAYLEVHSTHPIGQSILQAFGDHGQLETVDEVKEIPGEGLAGIFNGQQLLAGNGRLMDRYQIDIPEKDFEGTVVHVAYGSRYEGNIQIADEIKPEVENLADELRKQGAKEIIMLTGDQKHIAEQVARTLKMDRVFSELLPQDKMAHVEALIEEGKKVLFVGDGINDAPVLARADLGVAMGGLGSDAAIEAADMVLMTDEPMKLLEARQVARKTRRIVLQNIVFALGVKLFFLSLGAMGAATMYEAIFADVGVALIAVLNAMRVLRV